MRKLFMLLFTVSLAAVLSGCSTASHAWDKFSEWAASPAENPIPVNTAIFEGKPIDTALKALGYVPSHYLYGTDKDSPDYNKVTGAIYTMCTDSPNDCADHYRTDSTDEHPGVWVNHDKVVMLQGGLKTLMNDHSFCVQVPETKPASNQPNPTSSASPSLSATIYAPAITWQDFDYLTVDQQKQLLGIVPVAYKLFNSDILNTPVELNLPVVGATKMILKQV